MLGVSEIRHLKGARLPGAHSHAGVHQLVLVCHGEPIVYIDGTRYTAAAPCVIFISRLEQHSWHLPGEAYERYTVNFDPDALCSGEELRLLYVAMTRAREKLILVGAIKASDRLIHELMGLG